MTKKNTGRYEKKIWRKSSNNSMLIIIANISVWFTLNLPFTQTVKIFPTVNGALVWFTLASVTYSQTSPLSLSPSPCDSRATQFSIAYRSAIFVVNPPLFSLDSETRG
ncbi:hypothetical protein L1987_56102 [Smallanthus sonchifolius]|uniref:Uncharacterized protein n=1 Tax=Smallanthus sonchifolius TaxID=185202 RepID=A0ACB9ECI6_9ASTR|nr:hypothetical protein L1987_56102 [Smallanthus sonchifolius]